jgi:osmotically-inducible protein OsmY
MHRRPNRKVAALTLAAFVALGAAGCGKRGAENGNNANAAGNANRAGTATNYNSAGGANNNPAASSDTALKNNIQANLTKAGVSGVEVEVEDGVVTLKGNVSRARMQDAVKAANDAGPKRVLNQLNAQ